MDPIAAAFDRLFPVRADPARGPDPVLVERAERLLRPLGLWFRTEMEGVERLPQGGALLVSNHGPLGFDSAELVLGLYRRTGRLARGLAERTLFRFAPAKRLLESLGAVAGTRENAVDLLRAGELVLVYPGGAREALKGSAGRYRLAWDKATGFAAVALAARVPIVPVAGIGVDDYYHVREEPEAIARTLVGRAIRSVLGHDKYVPPRLAGIGPLPLPTKLRFVFGDPLDPRALAGALRCGRDAPDGEAPDDARGAAATADRAAHDPAAHDPARLDAIRAAVKERLERMLQAGLDERRHPVWG